MNLEIRTPEQFRNFILYGGGDSSSANWGTRADPIYATLEEDIDLIDYDDITNIHANVTYLNFDGKNHKITNWNVISGDAVGLICYNQNYGTFKDFSAEIYVSTEGGASILYLSNTIIKNIKISGHIDDAFTVLFWGNTIKNCSFTGSLNEKAGSTTNGSNIFISANSNKNINNCYLYFTSYKSESSSNTSPNHSIRFGSNCFIIFQKIINIKQGLQIEAVGDYNYCVLLNMDNINDFASKIYIKNANTLYNIDEGNWATHASTTATGVNKAQLKDLDFLRGLGWPC